MSIVMMLAARISTALLGTGMMVLAEPIDYLREVKPLLTEQCYKCHGASQHKGGLRLDTRELALKGGDHGAAIKVGKSSESLMISAVEGTHDEVSRMPYKKPPLTKAQIDLLKDWIDRGAPSPADEKPETSKHWAFIPPTRPSLPRFSRPGLQPANPIDAFVQSRLGQERIAPSPEADRVTLIRRVSLDLTGLPPLPADVDEFVRDTRPDAYERLVDRLLASPRYGERWSRWWLDAARYADSNGYSIDAPRQIWKYRDWVVAAFNNNLPLDQFVIDQLAGDLLPNATVEQKIATGFHRNTQINQEGGIDPEQFRVESVIDRVNTTATVFLGITLGCAQCHDHKFDPITQREYYQMFAFFNSQIEDGHGKAEPLGMLEVPSEFESMDGKEKEMTEAKDELERYLDTKGSALQKWEKTLSSRSLDSLQPEVRAALKIAFAERTLEQKRMVYAAYRTDDAEFNQRNSRLSKLINPQPNLVKTLVMQELTQPRESHVFIKGDFTRLGEKVTPGVPAVLHPFSRVAGEACECEDASGTSSTSTTSLPNRLDLAHWIVATNNPLTARVIVNRIWQQYFGTGIVETENDFGTQGSPPTNPELLDWLACELTHPVSSIRHPASDIRDSSWSLKHIHRLIVTSSTYRQSSHARPDLCDIDPNNKLLARQNRLRLDAEAVRDVELSMCGLLSSKLGGPPVYPPQPDGVMTLGQVKRTWKASAGADRYRRGIYTHFWRATPHPALAVFDAPDAFSACTRRIRSNTPLQALTLLNDQQYTEMASALAARVLATMPDSDAKRLDYAFRLCLARHPGLAERQRLLDLIGVEMLHLNGEQEVRQSGAWMTVARVLLNLDETITRE